MTYSSPALLRVLLVFMAVVSKSQEIKFKLRLEISVLSRFACAAMRRVDYDMHARFTEIPAIGPASCWT